MNLRLRAAGAGFLRETHSRRQGRARRYARPSACSPSRLCRCNAHRVSPPRSASRRCRAYRICGRPALATDERRYGSHIPIPLNHWSRSRRRSIPARPCAAANRPWRRCSAYLRVEEDSATLDRFSERANPPAFVHRQRASELAEAHEQKVHIPPYCGDGAVHDQSARECPSPTNIRQPAPTRHARLVTRPSPPA
jgi:hypothetical protein